MSSENTGPDGVPEIKILSANEAAGFDMGSGIYTGLVNLGNAEPEESVRNWTSKGGVEEFAAGRAALDARFSGGQERKVGRFVVTGEIGKGGMGEVLKAMDPLNGRTVALKILDESALKDRETLIRFEREAAAAADLDHPNIAKMYGLHYDDEGRPFIVMEFIDGTPLDKVIRERLDLLFSEMLDWIIQAARGLEFARRRGIIHRDIKPANIIIDQDNTVRIIDFGLAKSMWDTSGVTATGMVVGTPRYMSPEQGMGRNVDHRSDIYALGATLYELITKQTPFDGDTPMSIMMKHINSPLTPPYVLHPKCPSDINEIVVKMLAKDPKDRYQDYEPLIHDLESARIHRLAKEKAHEATSHDDLHGSPTMVELEPATRNPYNHGASGSGESGRKPNPYLSEGLVKLDMSNIPDAEEPSKSPLTMIMVGVGILGIVVFFAWTQSGKPQEDKPAGWVSKAMTRVFGERGSEASQIEEAVRVETEKIATTIARIEGVKFMVTRYRRDNRGELPAIRDLVRTGLVSDDTLIQDAWGNTFTIQREGNDLAITAPGADGVAGTTDDFKLYIDSSRRQVPAAPTVDELEAARRGVN